MTVAQLSESPRRLYTRRQKVYPRRVSGLFRQIKWAVLVLTLTVYYITPWIRFDRGEGVADQAVLIDMAGRRAWFFFIEIWPQDIYLLTLLLILAALTLFFVTSLAGRLWCGYACPQTVWTDLYMWVERRIEGDARQRRKRDDGPLTFDKAARKAAKHLVWVVIALATGGAWIFYFQDAPTALPQVMTGGASATVYFFIGLFTCTTYVLGGWAREQVCTYMCPWPRFQAAMFDEDTLIVAYQDWRGEPRGRHVKRQDKRQAERKALSDDAGFELKTGDCVDCGLCVEVCPTGVDIRDGNQLECIGCGLCVDACNNVMEKLGREGWLIRHDTERNHDRLTAGQGRQYKLFRARTLIYLVLLLGFGGLTSYALATKPIMDIDVIADRAPLFVTLSDGSVRNGYTLKIMNKTHQPRPFVVELDGLDQAVIQAGGQGVADPDRVTTSRIFVVAPPEGPKAQSYTIILKDQTGNTAISEETVFRRSGNLQ